MRLGWAFLGVSLAACSSGGNAGGSASGSTSGTAGGSTTTTSSAGGSTGSAGGGGASTTSTSSTSGSGGGCAIAGLGDTFDGASLDPAWTVFNPSAVAISQQNGALTLKLTKVALWYQASLGVLVHKPVTGDFKLTTTVHVRKGSNPQVPPDLPVQLAGLMARSPNGVDMGGKENYVFIVAGHDTNEVGIETKSTTDSQSDYIGKPWPSGDADLRMCRAGAMFLLYKRKPGDSAWTQALSYSRPDLPAKLQVGVNIYDASGPDVTATFDQVSFACVASPGDCDKD